MKFFGLTIWPISHLIAMKNLDPKNPPKASYKIIDNVDWFGHIDALMKLIPVGIMCWLSIYPYSVK
jgi:hypothetical protein